MRKYSPYFLAIMVIFLTASCEEESSPLFDQQSFTKIYDNSFFSDAYYPIDLKQTSDGGYLILSSRKLKESNFAGINIMKADKSGVFVKDIQVDEAYTNPIGELMELDGSYYFFCMSQTLDAQLVKVDANANAAEMTAVSGGDNLHSYPAAAGADGNNFILLNYDHEAKLSVLSLVNATGGVVSDVGVDIGVGDAVEEPIINHFFQTGRKFPFQVGRIAGGSYYFNGFYNYTFSLVFTNFNEDDPVTGTVQGQQDDGGFSAIESTGGNRFAASRFNYGDNFLLPNVTLSPSGVTSSTDLGGNTLPELVANAEVKILRAVIKEKNILIFGSDTRSKQIGLLFYDEAAGTFYGTHYLGFSNPFELGNMVNTTDGGLAVCGTTYVAGRFPRICLFKLSKDELSRNVK